MAKVQIVGPRLGIQFQGSLSAEVPYTWLDSEGVPIPGASPALTPAEDQSTASCKARFTNPNDEAKTFSTPVGTGPAPVASVAVAPFTVPANGTVDVDVLITFDGTQTKGALTYIELSGESDA